MLVAVGRLRPNPELNILKPKTVNVERNTTSSERLHKVLARAGVGSLRSVEAWIRAGRVKVNGRPAAVGARVAAGDRVTLDGNPVAYRDTLPTRSRILAYYKPAGELSSRSDADGRRTVFQALPGIRKGRWIAIGRLDLNSSGLMLFTNDGELANALMHPSSGVEREYAVRVLGSAGAGAIANMLKGVVLEDGPARFAQLTDAGGTGANHWYRVVILEGRKREVRRLWESQGLKVSRLIRIRFGSYTLPRYKRQGQFWELTRNDVDALYRTAGISNERKAARDKSQVTRRKKKTRAYTR